MKEIIIQNRFCGPPDSGNGGYTSGLIAKELNNPVEITLRKPPPLDKMVSLPWRHKAPEKSAHRNSTNFE